MPIKIFIDTGTPFFIDDPVIEGITTNPSLLKSGGWRNYRQFAEALLHVARGRPVSFEVLADDPDEIEVQARTIASWGENVYVKVPVTTCAGVSLAQVMRRLALDGIKINATAVFLVEQAIRLEEIVFSEGAPGIVSVFAGRIADTGRDPANLVRAISRCVSCEVLWASAREVLNVRQAESARAHIITLSPDLIAKLPLLGKNLYDFSLETVRQFHKDAQGLAL